MQQADHHGYEGIDQADYYLASVADSIYINPVGALDLHGMASVTPYMKKLFDKIGVEMQVIRVGTFKSAVEPYMLSEMSDANRLQQEHYLGTIWHEMVDSIAVDRKLQPVALNALCDSVVLTFLPDQLIKEKLVDKIAYKQEMENILRVRTQVDKGDDLNYVSPSDLADDLEAIASGDHIAVVYAVGEIDGSPSLMGGVEEGINSKKLSETILKLMDDDNVKGMVLRVNSPVAVPSAANRFGRLSWTSRPRASPLPSRWVTMPHRVVIIFPAVPTVSLPSAQQLQDRSASSA